MSTSSILFEPFSSIVQEDEGTMFIPVWSQLNTSCGEISSIVTVSTTDCKKRFLEFSKISNCVFAFWGCCFALYKIHPFQKWICPVSIDQLSQIIFTTVLQNTLCSIHYNPGRNISTSLSHVFIWSCTCWSISSLISLGRPHFLSGKLLNTALSPSLILVFTWQR